MDKIINETWMDEKQISFIDLDLLRYGLSDLIIEEFIKQNKLS